MQREAGQIAFRSRIYQRASLPRLPAEPFFRERLAIIGAGDGGASGDRQAALGGRTARRRRHPPRQVTAGQPAGQSRQSAGQLDSSGSLTDSQLAGPTFLTARRTENRAGGRRVSYDARDQATAGRRRHAAQAAQKLLDDHQGRRLLLVQQQSSRARRSVAAR